MPRAVLLVAATLGLAIPQSPALPLFRDIARSNDIVFLERLCTDRPYAEAEYAQRGRSVGGVKGTRTAAYVRLGAIGTAESLGAIARIEKAMHHRSVLPQPAAPGAPAYHPAPHMTDSVWRPAARKGLEDGREIAAYVLNVYGPPSLFLAIADAGDWSAPLMVPSQIPYGEPPQIALGALANGRVRVEFSAPEARGNVVYAPTPDAIEVRLAELLRDTDGDGWTDILERHLGLGWRSTDSDADGVADGRDSAPDFREAPSVDDEDAQMIRRAVFAMFGFTDSPGALFVADNSRRLQFDGLAGPVFYRDGHGGVRVTWKILEKTADTATVEITDFEGVLAASGHNLTLKKMPGGWYVVAIAMTWIS